MIFFKKEDTIWKFDFNISIVYFSNRIFARCQDYDIRKYHINVPLSITFIMLLCY